MVPRRRKELLFEVLGGGRPSTNVVVARRDPAGREAAAGALIAVALLVVVALGGYYLASRTGDPGGTASLSAERPDVSSAAPEREVAPARTESGAAAPVAVGDAIPAYSVVVRTIKWDNKKVKAAVALDETTALVDWLRHTKGLSHVRAIKIPDKDGYEVYVGASDVDGPELKKLRDRIQDFTYLRSATYFEGAYIKKKPLG
jgi:hypothetical protein